MRERGTQARRPRPGPPDRVRRADLPPDSTGSPRRRRPSDGVRTWQIVAIVAIIAATSGWTAAAMLAMREPAAAVVTPTDDPAADTSDGPAPSIEYSHTVPALEATLPTLVDGTTLVTESWTGDQVIPDTDYGQSVTAFLASKGKTTADLQAGQSLDPAELLDLVAQNYRAEGVAPADLLAAMIAGTKADSPGLVVSSITLDGQPVTKGVLDSSATNFYWLIKDGLVYEIQTSDDAIATHAIAAIPAPGAAGAPGTSPSASAKPSGAASAAPSGSSAP